MNNKFYTKQENNLISSIMDKYRIHKKDNRNTSTNFLNPSELKLAISYLNSEKINYSIYEPYPFLEKKIIYFGEYDNFVTFYKISISKEITHSHILGTLFSLSLNPNTIGDIFLEDGYFYYTNLTRMNPFLESNFLTINRQKITLNKVDEIILKRNQFEELTITVSSLRLDNIISKLANCSRNQALDMLKNKLVLLNYQEEIKTHTIIHKDDIISIRRVGKFKIGSEKGYTKKNNLILEIYKYM